MYFNETEKPVVETFYNNIDEYEKHSMILKWKNKSQVTAVFDTCFEDDNDVDMDDKNYEEYSSFVFRAVEVKGNPPIHITEDDYFLVNYHNFPDEIIVGGKKIN